VFRPFNSIVIIQLEHPYFDNIWRLLFPSAPKATYAAEVKGRQSPRLEQCRQEVTQDQALRQCSEVLRVRRRI